MPFINDQLEHNAELVEHRKNAQRNDVSKSARMSRFKFDPQIIMKALRARIIGQNDALNALENTLFTIKADFNQPNKPLSIMLFIGPTGVGKTEVVRILSELIHGSTNQLCRIDMNTLAQEHYSAAITGSPPGYVGSKEGQTLFNPELIKGTYSAPGIVLFDEIEKANRDVVRAILNVLDTGKLKLSSGTKEIDFSNSMIFMTSNIGVKSYDEHIAKFRSGWRRILKRKPNKKSKVMESALQSHFDLEFLNRIEKTITFELLTTSLRKALILLEIDKLNERLKKRHANIKIDELALDRLSEEYNERFGARGISRKIKTDLDPPIAKALLTHTTERDFLISLKNGEFSVGPVSGKG